MALNKGQKQFSKSDEGMALAHMAFSVMLAHDIGGQVQFVSSDDGYKGTLIYTPSAVILHRGIQHEPLGDEDLSKEVLKVVSHASALANLAFILSDLPLRGGETEAVTTEMIDSPRKLHYQCMARSIAPEPFKAMGEYIDKLQYPSTNYWSVQAQDKVEQVFQAIATETLLPEDAPFPGKNSNYFLTKDKTMSALLAFGTNVPTVRVSRGDLYDLIRGNRAKDFRPTKGKTVKSGDKVKEVKKEVPPVMKGLAIYQKPIGEAVSDWQQVKKDGQISFKRGNQGYVGAAYTFRGEKCITLVELLEESFGQEKVGSKSLKRKRDADDEVPVRPKKAKRIPEVDSHALFRSLAGVKPLEEEPVVDEDMEDEESEDD